jgi:hypothetical protein
MRDVVLVVTVLAFFAISVGYVWACGRIIAADGEPEDHETMAGAAQ